MQEAVGGYIDIVGLDDNVCILLNDEGKLIGLEGNGKSAAISSLAIFLFAAVTRKEPLTSLVRRRWTHTQKFFMNHRSLQKKK